MNPQGHSHCHPLLTKHRIISWLLCSTKLISAYITIQLAVYVQDRLYYKLLLRREQDPKLGHEPHVNLADSLNQPQASLRFLRERLEEE